ncbi:site-specific DNA recombinase [Thermodesulfitimonas autotrophica]|uniref:Site-specific DNA recombinase n=1 Tax=Thermodesulfitimonas autotrophica TaxID=1894989 RepID=A0A3N5AW67_9THEO|nr:recombinase family protein [Thermodesulfitimonas autotrophica]RPF49204.1 site-specific DNA recombinase [Thermodesulfitimonas autotrophica]
MRAAIYVRVSTEDQALRGYSLPEQREACRKKAEELGAVEIIEFADEGVSGATLDRPGLNALLDAAREGRVDVVVCRDLDRLSRRLVHQLLLMDELEKAGVRMVFLDFAWQDTPEGRLFLNIRASIAEYERETIKRRTTRGKLRKAREGGIPISFNVYGYRYDPETGKVSVVEEEAEFVRKMFEWFTTEDIGIVGVAKRLNRMGVPTRKNAPLWKRQVVWQILRNPVFKGEWRYRGVTVPVPAIVDAATWERAQEKLREARRLWANRGRHDYLLSGIITCGHCGKPMHGVYIAWWGKKDRRYSCSKTKECAGYTGCRPPRYVLADRLEQAVWEKVKEVLSDPDALAREAAAMAPQAEGLRRELENVEELLARTEKGREAVLSALASGLCDLDAIAKSKLAELKRRKERLEARKKEIEAALRAAERAAVEAEELRALAKQVLSEMDSFSFEEKRALVRALVAQVIVTGRPKPGNPDKSMEGVNVTVVLRLGETGIAGVISRKE